MQDFLQLTAPELADDCINCRQSFLNETRDYDKGRAVARWIKLFKNLCHEFNGLWNLRRKLAINVRSNRDSKGRFWR